MIIGVDVSKDSLSVSEPSGNARTIKNTAHAVKELLSSIEPGSTVAMEATGSYHKLLADTAYHRGFTVMVFNPKDVLHYAKSLYPRAKTDSVDAKVIANFARVQNKCQPYSPVSPETARLRDLINTRALLVRSRVSMQNRMRDCAGSASYMQSALEGIDASIREIDRELAAISNESAAYKLQMTADGIGPVVGGYLLSALSSGEFVRSDSFVAFIGLDVRIKQSGKKVGRSCLTKRGDPEGRRLLYLAAQSVCNKPGPYAELYTRYKNNGLSKIAATVAVARKIARTSWAIHKTQSPYRPERVLNQEVRL